MLVLSQLIVNGMDWGAIGLSGCLFLVSVVGAFLAFHYSGSSRRPAAREFNSLWRARAFTQVLSACCALSLVLRLQLLWGPASIIKHGGFHPTAFCRVYIVSTYGVFEPGVMLLALFACLYSVQGRDSSARPNFFIVLFSVFFSLPAAAAQIVAALFTLIADDLNYGRSRMLNMLFATYTTQLPQHCDEAAPGNCVFCVFPLLSTFATTAFSAVYLVSLWIVTQRILAAVINKALARRVRTLQVLTTAWVAVSLACRGCTVLFQPFELGFEALRLAHLVALMGLVLTLQFFLVLKPVWDSQQADRALKRLEKQGTGLAAPLFPPTEMQPIDSCASAASRRPPEEDRV